MPSSGNGAGPGGGGGGGGGPPLYSPATGLVYIFNLIVGTGALTLPAAFRDAGWALSSGLIVMLSFMSYLTATFMIEAMAAANAMRHWKRVKQLKRRHRGTSDEMVRSSIRSLEEEDDDDEDEAVQQHSEQGSYRPLPSASTLNDNSSSASSATSSPGQNAASNYQLAEGADADVNLESAPLIAAQEQLQVDNRRSRRSSSSSSSRRSRNMSAYYDITEVIEMGKMAAMFFNKTGRTLFYICIIIYLYGDLAIYGAAVAKSLRDTDL